MPADFRLLYLTRSSHFEPCHLQMPANKLVARLTEFYLPPPFPFLQALYPCWFLKAQALAFSVHKELIISVSEVPPVSADLGGTVDAADDRHCSRCPLQSQGHG